MEFSRQEYWSGLPFPTSWDLQNPGTGLVSFASPALQADSLPLCRFLFLVEISECTCCCLLHAWEESLSYCVGSCLHVQVILYLKIYRFFYVEIPLINNALVSDVQPSDSVIHIQVTLLFHYWKNSDYYRFWPALLLDYYRILPRVPCVMQ